MTAKEIIARCANLDVYEERQIADDYAELVFYNKEMDKWYNVFTDIFGPPIKPAGVKPTEEALRLTENDGGICENQILFKKQFGAQTAIAMFWPWQDALHTTLKITFKE